MRNLWNRQQCKRTQGRQTNLKISIYDKEEKSDSSFLPN